MSQEAERNSEDLEVPDRQTAEAAEWLSKQGVEFDTPLFWHVTALLRMYRDSAMREAAGLVCAKCCQGYSVEKTESGAMFHNSPVITERTYCTAAAIHERLAQKGRE
jgi:hypothetical protein